jgi:hypothetical protein
MKGLLWSLFAILILLFLLAFITSAHAKRSRFYYSRLIEIEGLTNCTVEYESVRKIVLVSKSFKYRFFIGSNGWVIYYVDNKPVRVYTIIGSRWQILKVLR